MNERTDVKNVLFPLLLASSVVVLTACSTGNHSESGSNPPEPVQTVDPSNVSSRDILTAYIEAQEQGGRIDRSKRNWRRALPKFPAVKFRDDERVFWTMETTEGTMRFELFPHAAPQHVTNVMYLSLLGFYDGLSFHRIIPGFMAQGGDPTGSGGGGPGYQVPLEVNSGFLHRRAGVLSMARTNDPNSAGSQFFITFGPTPGLDMKYSVFGQMLQGASVLERLESAGNSTNNGVPPLREIRIVRAEIDVKVEK